VPQILASIEERLKSLHEALGGLPQVAVSKPLVDLEGLARRLEAVETRLGRIEDSLDTRLITLSEVRLDVFKSGKNKVFMVNNKVYKNSMRI